jgi:hypothetical protein
MGTHTVVDMLPFPKGIVEGRQIEITVVYLVEFLSVGPVGSLYVAIELRTAGREDKESDPVFLTSRLEGRLEL